MMNVEIDGVKYVPAGKASSRIGIAITTHNRPDVLKRAIEQHMKHLPADALIVVIDDGSLSPAKVPDGIRLIRHETARGIASSKNSCIELLMAAGCDHLFLFDDDTYPVSDNWWNPYIDSEQPHLMYMWGKEVIFRDGNIVGYQRPKGCMLYVERRVIERIGGMDPAFGRWGFEHESWSDRIHNAGFTTCRYQDVENSSGLFYAADEKGAVESSVPENVRLESLPHLAEQKRYSSEYVSYRTEPPIQANTQVSLSVLIPSVSSRWATFGRKIQEQIFGQYEALPKPDRDRVEILMITDTKSIQLGVKRNEMVRLASGEYVVFVDDDDRLAPDYVASLLKATESGADVITFQSMVSLNGGSPRLCRYSLQYPQDANTATEYHRIPNHICAIKRRIALRTPFPAKLCGEDREYAIDLRPLLKTEHAINRVLYHYDYNRETTETQLHQCARQEIVRRSRPPVIDVVFLSKGDTAERQQMTQNAISSCLECTGDQPVNVIVVEQADGVRYRDAIVIHKSGQFRYNAFANHGIAAGSAPWVMVANNDLEFQKGWASALLAANHPVVSPVSPGESRQAGITSNQTGKTNGKHFSGWCFMLSRALWVKIGGLDEDFIYWCADDSVIEQVVRAGVMPMLVPGAKVKHLISKTGGDSVPDEMTWGQVMLFERKYGVKKFESDARYSAYKKRQGITA
ncbi:glycosyltransferase [Leclercia adecarboxylata]|uniref:glycosyltransferase n=1 Tax=Leclercia adecarboxylata TaxID=83655 RepID=UPI0022B7D060|nr:glycosyltransferase [Leclercia adecarboxylata]MCZ7839696.1 glycosyltransferase [Leclercia adecarboxylata]